MNGSIFVSVLLIGAVIIQTSGLRNVCYYGSWSVYRQGLAKFLVEDIDPTLCTHVIYTFVGLNDDGSIRVLDEWNEVGDEWHEGAFTKLQKLRAVSPGTKYLIAIGGYNEGSEKYSRVANDPTKRGVLVQSAYNLVKTHGFDGFDLDWEYPTQRGGVPSDQAAFTALMRELRAKFDPEGLLLSAAISCNPETIDLAYDVPAMSDNLDFINIMTYDIHGSWDKNTGHNAPLVPTQRDYDIFKSSINVRDSVQHLINRGAAPSKINVGLATYGRTFTLADPNNFAVGAPATGAGQAGSFVQEAGFLAYNEICYQQTQNLWRVFRDDLQHVPYAVKGNQWVSYDDQQSIIDKVELVHDLGLGGSMWWSVETDDFDGICGNGKYPLIRAAVNALGGITFDDNTTQRPGTNPPPTTTTQRPETNPPGTTTTPTTSTTAQPTDAPQTTAAPTTTEQPAVRPPQSGDDLSRACASSVSGYVRNAADCSKFYQCQPAGGGSFIIHPLSCQSGLLFDNKLSTCNYPQAVTC